MGQLGRAVVFGWSVVWLAPFVLVSCAAEESPASLLALAPVTVSVNELLVVRLVVDNPDGLALDYSYSGPQLPSLALTASLSGTPAGGEFRWTPLASHVGSHQFDFVIRSSAGESRRSMVITVTPQTGSAPIFLTPGNGDTFDLTASPCVSVHLEVKDDDSSTVTLSAPEGLPAGASLSAEGAKSAVLGWCPTQAQQQQSLTWPLRFSADDGQHPPTEHRFLAVLRIPAKEGCPGAPPEVSVVTPATGATVEQLGGYRVAASVSDDLGVRDAPVLYYSSVSPDSTGAPPASERRQVLCESRGDGVWEGTIPPLGIPVGDSLTVWYSVSAVDNDDPQGTGCDHRTDTPWRSFVAHNGGAKAKSCGLCQLGSECESGLCAAPGVCVPACAGCALECELITDAAGEVTSSCGGTDGCSGLSSTPNDCAPDPFANNSVDEALSLLGGPLSAAICAPDEADFFSHLNGPEGLLTLRLDDLDGHDLDFSVQDAQGLNLALVSTGAPVEQVLLCVPAGSETFVQVFAYKQSPNPWGRYTLAASFVAGSCCPPDATEPNDAPSQATPLVSGDSFSGALCLQDSDWYRFEAAGPGEAQLSLSYDGSGLVDITLVGPLPSAKILKEAIAVKGTPAALSVWLPAAGTYALMLAPYDISVAAPYSGQLTLVASSACMFSYDCPVGQVCEDESQCVPDGCLLADPACPLGHICTALGAADDAKCAVTCVDDVECRDDRGERCKRFAQRRSCGLEGGGQAGAPCTSFEQCAGERVCLDWEGGYCAALGCTSTADCAPDERCRVTDDGGVCMRQCGRDGDPPCRTLEGYGCLFAADPGGVLFSGCGPVEQI